MMIAGFKRCSIICLIGATLSTPCVAQNPSKVAQAHDAVVAIIRNARLIEALSGMGAMDQLIRLRFLAIRKDATADERAALDSIFQSEFHTIDVSNTARLKQLLAGRDWFKLSEVGARAAGSAFSIVQHSDDLAFQREVLKKMEPLVGTDELTGESYALLYDRVAVQDGRPQRFGSQGADCKQGKYMTPSNVEDPTNLDRRRAALGMEPEAAYLAELDDMYGRC